MKPSRRNASGRWWLGTFAAATVLFATQEARSDQVISSRFPPPWRFYATNMVEPLATCTTLQAAVSSAMTGATAQAWHNFNPAEHIDCSTTTMITQVKGALYASDPKIREIVAWWLNKQSIFNSDSPNYYIYGSVLSDLKNNSSAFNRMCDINALGQFRAPTAVSTIESSLASDSDPTVRAAAASALGLQGQDPTHAINTGIQDANSAVQIASMLAATQIPTFNGVSALAAQLGSSTSTVQRQAIWTLQSLGNFDALTTVLALTRSATDPTVRAAACNYAGASGSSSAESTLNAVVATDSSVFVVDQAKIALMRL